MSAWTLKTFFNIVDDVDDLLVCEFGGETAFKEKTGERAHALRCFAIGKTGYLFSTFDCKA
ncbi:hypothetical protein JCM31598_43570 [Desulfonatronum parangueonense]